MALMSPADWVRKATVSSPMDSPPPRLSSTSYFTVGRYLYSRELFRDMLMLLGAKNGTSSREGLMSCSMAEKMSLIRRSGVV